MKRERERDREREIEGREEGGGEEREVLIKTLNLQLCTLCPQPYTLRAGGHGFQDKWNNQLPTRRQRCCCIRVEYRVQAPGLGVIHGIRFIHGLRLRQGWVLQNPKRVGLAQSTHVDH